MPYNTSCGTAMSYVSSTVHKNSSVDERNWSKHAVQSVMASTRKSGNHVCKPEVCHKRRHGKKDFCRFLFWSWTKTFDGQGKMIAQRSHGNTLQKRCNGTGVPPVHQTQSLQGCLALETTQPFHFKMTPEIMLGTSCNQDLGILLRYPSSVECANQALISMQESMGDHEFYCARYSSKEKPHIEGLLVALSDGLRCKARDIMVAKEKGEDFSSHEICRKLLHNLLASTNRRMHNRRFRTCDRW